MYLSTVWSDARWQVLRRLEDDQTLLVQSGKPVGVFRTHADAPRVIIANSNLVRRGRGQVCSKLAITIEAEGMLLDETVM
jgi:hypothetical protein